MTELSPKTIDKYKKIYLDLFSQEISDQEAKLQIQQLSKLFWVIYHKPLSNTEKIRLEKYMKK